MGVAFTLPAVVEGIALMIKSKATGNIKHMIEICNPPTNNPKDYTDSATDSPTSFIPVGNTERSSLLESMNVLEISIY
jgi:hypothetical protein